MLDINLKKFMDDALKDASVASHINQISAGDIYKALDDPEKELEIKKVLLDHKQSLLDVNMSQVSSSGFFNSGWRPACGWMLAYCCGCLVSVFAIGCIYEILWGKKLADFVTAFCPVLGYACLLIAPLGTVVGVYARGRTHEKLASAGVSLGGGLLNKVKKSLPL